MTIKQILNHGGILHKPFERYHQSSPSGQGYYGGHEGYNQAPNYHGSPPRHIVNHYGYSHSSGGGNKGGGAALSALTLLSFLFFLSILQQCLKDQMNTMSPSVMVMTAGREDMPNQVKQAKVAEQRKSLEVDSIARDFPEVHPENDESLTMVELKVPQDDGPILYVDAMGDGIGEVINEQ